MAWDYLSSGGPPRVQLDIRFWSTGDEKTTHAIVNLINKVFPSPHRTVEWFRWKHAANPLGPSIVVYAENTATGKVVGVRAFWRCRLWHRGKSMIAFQPCDTVTHPEFRRQGIFSQLTMVAMSTARDEGADVLFNFPNPQSKPGNLKLGWQDVGGMHALVKVLRPARVAECIAGSRGRLSRFQVEPRNTGLPRGQVSSEGDDPFDYVNRGDWISGDRGLTYLQWRLADHPFIAYQILDLGHGKAILRLGYRGTLREVSILDIFSPQAKHRLKVLRELVRTIKAKYQADLATMVLSRHHEFFGVMLRSGFVPLRSRVNFVARSLRSDMTVVNTAMWRLSGCDIDTF